MLKHTAAAIAPALTLLFYQSLKSSIVPEDWKVTHVTPVPKISSPKCPENFHPISLLSFFAKLLRDIFVTKSLSSLMKITVTFKLSMGF